MAKYYYLILISISCRTSQRIRQPADSLGAAGGARISCVPNQRLDEYRSRTRGTRPDGWVRKTVGQKFKLIPDLVLACPG
jgi:hypothetical protein